MACRHEESSLHKDTDSCLYLAWARSLLMPLSTAFGLLLDSMADPWRHDARQRAPEGPGTLEPQVCWSGPPFEGKDIEPHPDPGFSFCSMRPAAIGQLNTHTVTIKNSGPNDVPEGLMLRLVRNGYFRLSTVKVNENSASVVDHARSRATCLTFAEWLRRQVDVSSSPPSNTDNHKAEGLVRPVVRLSHRWAPYQPTARSRCCCPSR